MSLLPQVHLALRRRGAQHPRLRHQPEGEVLILGAMTFFRPTQYPIDIFPSKQALKTYNLIFPLKPYGLRPTAIQSFIKHLLHLNPACLYNLCQSGMCCISLLVVGAVP